MKRREFLKKTGQALSSGVLASAAGVASRERTKRPNVLYIFSDQQQARSLVCYGGGPARTPSLDRLVREGCRFEHALSTYPVCSPYRAMLMSGRFPMRNGVVSNDVPLSDGLPTFGKMFREAGYQTGYIGKWHLEDNREGFVPERRRQGFDYWAVHTCNHKHFDSPYYMDDPDKELIHHGYEPDSQTRLAMDFIRRAVKKDAPFCLGLSFGPPHPPYKAPQEYEERFLPSENMPLPPNVNERKLVEDLLRTDHRPLNERTRERRRRMRALLADDGRLRREVLVGYYAAWEALDTNVGRLLDVLEETGAARDTIVVYTSDHGDLAGAHRMLSKQNPLEESIGIPFLIRYPRAVPAGTVTPALLAPVDILPTLLSLCGIPYDPDQYDGQDRGPVAFAGATDSRDALLIMKMVHGGNPWVINGIRPWRGVRTQRYTYAEMEGQPWILFDNQEDPYQMNNRIADPGTARLRRALHRRMKELMAEAGDTLTEEQILAFRSKQVATYGTRARRRATSPG